VRNAVGCDYLYATGMADEIAPDQVAWIRQLPAGCEALQRNGPALARQAAELDACARLAARLARWQPAAERPIDMDALVDALMAPSSGTVVDQVAFHPSAICTLRGSLPAAAAERLIRKVTEGASADLRTVWLAQMNKGIRQEPLEETGYGVPPPVAWRPVGDGWVDVDPPAWVEQTLHVTASVHLTQAERSAGDPAAVAMAAARIEGLRLLALKVDELEMPADGTVADFLARHEELARDLAMFFTSARAVAEPEYDASTATARVQLALPLDRLWRILKTRMVPVNVDAPAAPPADDNKRP
jgi:hypothetical protein